MSLQETVNDSLRDAMKTRDQVRLAALRMLKTELTQAETAKARRLTSDEELDVVKRMVRKRQDSIDLYRKGKRDDLADMETAQLAVLESFLPARLPDDEMDRIIDLALAEFGELDPNMTTGILIGRVMSKLRATGKMFDGRMASERVLSRFKI